MPGQVASGALGSSADRATLAAFNLDFLCIHPFRDGNGRVSRLLLLLGCYQLGYEAGRYISLERVIEENKERCYETLETISQRWHEAKHDPWLLVNFLLYVLKLAYGEFERRVGQTTSPKGAKTEMIEAGVESMTAPFTINDLERACPGVSRDMVRRVLRSLKEAGQVQSLGRGPGALWEKRGSTLKKVREMVMSISLQRDFLVRDFLTGLKAAERAK
jgi:Fic family protein